MLCNVDDCINYQCKIRKKNKTLAAKSSWSGFKREEVGNYKTDTCGFKLDFLRGPIDELIERKVND